MMQKLILQILFSLILFPASGQIKTKGHNNAAQGTYTISAGHISVIDSRNKDTAFLNCYLKVLHNGHCTALDQSGFIIANGKKYYADSAGYIQLRLSQNFYTLTAGSGYKIIPGRITTKRFYYNRQSEYYLYFYLIETGR